MPLRVKRHPGAIWPPLPDEQPARDRRPGERARLAGGPRRTPDRRAGGETWRLPRAPQPPNATPREPPTRRRTRPRSPPPDASAPLPNSTDRPLQRSPPPIHFLPSYSPSGSLAANPPTRTSPTHHQARHHTPAQAAAAPPPAQPHHAGAALPVYLAGRGRGVQREAVDPPSSKAQAPSQTRPEAGRPPDGLLRRTPRDEHQEANTQRRTRWVVETNSLRPRGAGG
jgi:hypothetical protein